MRVQLTLRSGSNLHSVSYEYNSIDFSPSKSVTRGGVKASAQRSFLLQIYVQVSVADKMAQFTLSQS